MTEERTLGRSPGAVRFTSELTADQRPRLEELLFFNANQGLYRDAVIESIERFGEPRIEERDGRLRIRTTLLGEVQTLFALEERAGGVRPIGAAVYYRTAVDAMTLLHVGVHPDFAATGPFADALIAIRLVQQIAKAASRIKEVRRVVMPYGSAESVTIARPMQEGR